jgi:hypothetical protein
MPEMSRTFRAAAVPRAPSRGGTHPRLAHAVPPVATVALTVAVALGVDTGCSKGSADQVTAPIAVAMTSQVAPFYDDGNLALYQVETPVRLPVRRPSDAERHALGPAPQGTPYAHAPFLRAEDESIEVHYVISNVDGAKHTVWLLVDPWNEFVRWRPGVTVVNGDVTVPNFSGYEKGFVIPGKQRIEGTLTSDDMHEMAIKLASVENALAAAQATATQMPPQPGQPQTIGNCGVDATTLANLIFNQQNKSNSGNPCYTPWIPPVVAGLTGFDLGLRTMDEAANVAVEITIDVLDINGNRFVAQDTTTAEIGMPAAVLSPPSARF